MSFDPSGYGEEDSPAWQAKEQARQELFAAMITFFKRAIDAEMGDVDQAMELENILVEIGKGWEVKIPDNKEEEMWG